MNHQWTRLYTLFILLLIEASCTFATDPQSEPKIIGGRLPPLSSPAHSSTVALVKSNPGQDKSTAIFCSGTLIARNLIVTAAHCLDGRSRSSFKVLFGTSDKDAASTSVDVIDFKLFTDDWSKFSPNFDIAWVKIAEDAPAEYIPIEIFHDYKAFSTREEQEQEFLLAGYGNQKTGCKTADCVGIKLEVEAKLRDPIYRNSRLFSILVFGTTPFKGICNGDSGGSAFYRFRDKWYLIGALNGHKETLTPLAFKDPDLSCESGESIYSFTGDFAAWIEETAAVTLDYDASSNQRHAVNPVMLKSEAPETLEFASWYTYNNYGDEAWYTVDRVIQWAATASLGEDRLAMYRDPERVVEFFERKPSLELISVSDIRPILGLPLESLYLVSTDLSAYSLLSHLKQLRILKIAPGLFHSGSFDASFINELKELRYLSLSDFPQADLSLIAWQELVHLQELHLNNLGPNSLKFLEEQPLPPSLRKIYVDGSPLQP